MKIALLTIFALIGIVGGAFIASTVNQPSSKAQKLETITQSSPTPSNTITTTAQQTATPQPSTQPNQTVTQQPQTTVQQPPTIIQQPTTPAESYRQSTNSCPGKPLRIRAWEDYDLTAESNVGAVKPCDYVLVGSNRVSVNSFSCDGSKPLEFVKVTVPPETEVLDPATDDEQPNNVQPRREGYAATCGLNLQSRAIKGRW